MDVIPLATVPINVAVEEAFFMNIAMKKGTKRGATNRLLVL